MLIIIRIGIKCVDINDDFKTQEYIIQSCITTLLYKNFVSFSLFAGGPFDVVIDPNMTKFTYESLLSLIPHIYVM